jgi:phosphoserine phosphatase RsbU/P
MTQHTLTLAASVGALSALGSRADPVERWWRSVADCWPAGSELPAIRSLPLESLVAQLSCGEGGRKICHASPILVVLGPDACGSSLYQLVDRLQQNVVPAVMLLPAVDPSTRQLQSGGVIIDAWDADPSYLAAVLFALAERQSAVRALKRELTILSRYQGGVRGEIDRIHDELNLAAAVQQEMLPRALPEVTGIDFGVLFRPAGYVSGDIYDVVQLDERHVGFFIADAVGHGVPAALMTMVISRSLRMTHAAAAPRHIVSPAEAMTRLNDELCRGKRDAPRFSTAVYGIIDTLTRCVTMSGAGHPPPLRIRERCMSRVETDGPLLGVFPGEQYTDVSFTMSPGETLLLYSDGFETAFAPPALHSESGAGGGGDTGSGGGRRRAGNDWYLRELTSLKWPCEGEAYTASEAMLQLGQRLDEQAGSLHQIDDVTALAISVRTTAALARTKAQRFAA